MSLLAAFNPSGSAVCEIPWLDNYHGHLNLHSGACFDLRWVSACLNRLSCRTCGQLLDHFPNVQLNSWTRWSDSETGECSCSQLRHGVLCSSATFAQMLIDKWWLQLLLEIWNYNPCVWVESGRFNGAKRGAVLRWRLSKLLKKELKGHRGHPCVFF